MKIVLALFVFCLSFTCEYAICDDTAEIVQQGIGAVGGFLKNKPKTKGNDQKGIVQSNPVDVLQKGDPSRISNDGVFYPGAEMTVAKENVEPFKVFDIPLGASVQDVFSALEKKGIDFRGGVSQDANIQTSIRNDIERFYESKGITGDRKEAALRVIDEGKFILYPFQYGGQKYWLYPDSLNVLMKSGLEPVFDKYYQTYNSQFAIELRYPSEDMKSQGVVRAYVLFGKVGQEEPKSYLISLQFGQNANPKLAAVLNKKYGLPKVYSVDIKKNDSDINQIPLQILSKFADASSYIKSKSKNFETKAPNESIDKVGENFLLSDSLASNQIQSTFYFNYNLSLNLASRYYQGYYYFPYIFEWDVNPVKILAEFNSLVLEKTLEDSSIPLILDTGVVNYIYFPLATQLADGITETINASKQVGESQKNKAEEGL